MKNIALAFALLMLGSGVALAKDTKAPKADTTMSDAEMDNVVAGNGNGVADGLHGTAPALGARFFNSDGTLVGPGKGNGGCPFTGSPPPC